MRLTREDAWQLLTEHTQNPSLLKHALAVEAAMRAYARKYGEDEEVWGITGLIHDFDYEEHPTAEEHPMVGVAMLESLEWPDAIIYAVKGHARHLNTPRDTLMAKALFAVDELTGFIAACALVRPDKSVHSLTTKSVRNKWKDKAFARGVDRADIELGTSELGVDLGEHIGFVIEALKPVARELGLDGAGADAKAS
ncbi:MAG: HDIG domain-containing protein [Chloroflexi bacterium]|nr:HDIG domain-containing protein [Chloroflexota bacterium]